MLIYTIEKSAMKVVKSMLTQSARNSAAGTREWTKYAYLYEKGLILTDGTRLLRFHDADLDFEFSSFIRETGRVVVFSLEGDSLKMEYDIDKKDTEVGTMERLIPSDEKFTGSGSAELVIRFTPEKKTPKPQEIAKSMLNTAILSTRRWFDPDRFKDIGFRPWTRVFAMNSIVSFRGYNEDEVFVCMGTRWEDFA